MTCEQINAGLKDLARIVELLEEIRAASAPKVHTRIVPESQWSHPMPLKPKRKVKR